MSIHSSLRGISTLTGERSVLSRFERVQKMMRDGRLKAEGGSPFGLPKMRTKLKIAGKKPKEAAAADDKAKPAAGGKKPAAGAAPAAAAKPAAGGKSPAGAKPAAAAAKPAATKK